jgi:nucleoside phosphorylase
MDSIERILKELSNVAAKKQSSLDFCRKDMNLDSNNSKPTSNNIEHEISNATKDCKQLVDIVIITALQQPEKEAVLKLFSSFWEERIEDGVLYKISDVQFSNCTLSVAVACQNDMGMVPATILTTKAIRSWQPAIVIMTGICGGVKGKVNLGDIIIVQNVFDYGSGKIINGKLQPDYSPLQMNANLCNLLIDFSRDKDNLSSILTEWPTESGKPETHLKAHVGSLASGAAVVADDSVVIDIQSHKRSLLGVDMEAYGVARATVEVSNRNAKFLIVKGVTDFADVNKSDDIREFCAYASASFVKKFISKFVDNLF